MADTNPLSERQRIGRCFLGIVRQKISGIIDQRELERLARDNPFAEQLQLGIGASTEVRKA